jgi:TetR/AcrR family transcriptional repressor of nem operon
MGRPKNYDRNDVLERATRVFWTKGYEGTHLSELVDATGLNRFSLYNEFGGKEGLFQATLDHYIASLGELLSLLDREPQGLANIRAFHRAQLGHDFQDGCYALNTIREKNVVPAAAWGTIQGFTQGMRERLRRNLRAAAKVGELPKGADPDVLASSLAVFGIGLLTFRSLGAKPSEALRLVEEAERLLE